MSGVSDWLFGDQESTKGMDITKGDNQRRWDLIQEQTRQAREDLHELLPPGANAMRRGYGRAINVTQRVPVAQMRALSAGSRNAQRSLIDGMAEYRRAIMGEASPISFDYPQSNPAGFRPVSATATPGLNAPFDRNLMPGFLTGQRAQQAAEQAAAQTQEPAAAAAMAALQGGPIQVPWGQIGANVNWSTVG